MSYYCDARRTMLQKCLSTHTRPRSVLSATMRWCHPPLLRKRRALDSEKRRDFPQTTTVLSTLNSFRCLKLRHFVKKDVLRCSQCTWRIFKPSSSSKDPHLLLSCLHQSSRGSEVNSVRVCSFSAFCLLSIKCRHLGENGSPVLLWLEAASSNQLHFLSFISPAPQARLPRTPAQPRTPARSLGAPFS